MTEQVKLEIELAQTEHTLRELRPELLRLKPKYGKQGRPSKAERAAHGYMLTRKEWEGLWKRPYEGWGGRRDGSGSLPRGRTHVRVDFTIPIDIAEALQRLPKGERSKYVVRALELLIRMVPPDGAKPEVPPRGRHAHKAKDWKQTRATRMTPIELARHKLELARAKLEEAKTAGF